MTKFSLTTFEELAAYAKPLDDTEWGSNRQIEAENTFFHIAREQFPELFSDNSDFSMWALKATTDEMLDHAMALIRKAMGGDPVIDRTKAVEACQELIWGADKEGDHLQRVIDLSRQALGLTV